MMAIGSRLLSGGHAVTAVEATVRRGHGPVDGSHGSRGDIRSAMFGGCEDRTSIGAVCRPILRCLLVGGLAGKVLDPTAGARFHVIAFRFGRGAVEACFGGSVAPADYGSSFTIVVSVVGCLVARK